VFPICRLATLFLRLFDPLRRFATELCPERTTGHNPALNRQVAMQNEPNSGGTAGMSVRFPPSLRDKFVCANFIFVLSELTPNPHSRQENSLFNREPGEMKSVRFFRVFRGFAFYFFSSTTSASITPSSFFLSSDLASSAFGSPPAGLDFSAWAFAAAAL